MNISKELKKKRDAEARLNKQSQTPVYVGSGGNPSNGGGTVEGDTFVTNETIINQIMQVIQNQLIAGDNITITDNLDGTYTIAGQATADLMFDGGTASSLDFTINFDGGEA